MEKDISNKRVDMTVSECNFIKSVLLSIPVEDGKKLKFIVDMLNDKFLKVIRDEKGH